MCVCCAQCCVVVGGLSVEKQTRLLRRCPDIVIATPGRLWQLIEQVNYCLHSASFPHWEWSGWAKAFHVCYWWSHGTFTDNWKSLNVNGEHSALKVVGKFWNMFHWVWKLLLADVKYMPPVGFIGINILVPIQWWPVLCAGHRCGSWWCSDRPRSCCRKVVEVKAVNTAHLVMVVITRLLRLQGLSPHFVHLLQPFVLS